MAGICANCGAALASTSGFCTNCGAAVGAAPAEPTAPSAQQDGAAQAKSSGGAAKVILIVVAIVVGIGILGAGALGFTAWHISKASAANNSKSNDAMFSIPGLGSISTGSDATADPTQLGAPLYPGAVQQKGAVSVGISAAGVTEAHFTTGDPESAVVAFYTSNIPGAIVAATGNTTVINAPVQSQTDRVTVTITPGSGSNAGQTTIAIVRTTKN